MNPYEELGRQIVGQLEVAAMGELIGAEGGGGGGGGGFDFSQLINAAAEAANKGYAYSKEHSAQQKSAAERNLLLQKSISADAAWASAEQQLDIVQQSKDSQRIGPAQVLQQQAMAVAMQAGAALDQDGLDKRLAAARKAEADAANAALKAPQDELRQALSRAWHKVAAAVAMATPSIPGASTSLVHLSQTYGSGESWLTRVHGGLPTYGWIGLGAAAVTVIIMLMKHMRK